MNKARAYLLTGKVASGKTTYARRIEAEENSVFLSLDELQLSIFGSVPTREQLDSSFEGARAYQLKLALKFLSKGIDVLFDWGFWSKAGRCRYKEELEGFGFEVQIVYFNIADEVRLEWNARRNRGDDESSFKIEPHDVALFDSMYEEPVEDEYDVMITG